MWFCLTLLGALLLGGEGAHLLWKRGQLSWPERALFAFLSGVLLWLASDWLLALPHVLSRPFLIGRTLLFLIVALVLLARRAPDLVGTLGSSVSAERTATVVAAVPLLLLFVWIDYCLWRGAVAPPVSLDALSYHLPKAMFFVRAHGYDPLRAIRFVFTWRPSNYELLLADAIAGDHSDALTEWISTLFYGGFVLASTALARRWWGSSVRALAAVALISGSIPVVLLQAADYKNDVMAACFLIGGCVAMGRWMSERDAKALTLCVAAFCAAAGLKTHAAVFASIAGLIIIATLWRSPRRLAAIVFAAGVAFILLGGADYAAHALERLGRAQVEAGPPTNADVSYGDWANLWKGPYLLLTESFSTNPNALHMPWSSVPWPWRRYELYYSELGVAFSIAAMALLIFLRPAKSREAAAMTAIAFVSAAIILPVHYTPSGLFLLGLPRFLLFLAPIVFAWTVPPLVQFLERKAIVVANAAVLAAAILFVVYAVQNAMRDVFVPFDYVVWTSDHRGSRIPPHARLRAATTVLDLAAGPQDSVAMDAGPTSLIYLLFGRSLQRPVAFIPPGSGPPAIPPQAKWVVIDRAGNLIWGARNFNDLSEATRYLRRGGPSDDDLRVLRFMLRDPRFERVYFEPSALQAVFRRK